MLAVAVVEARNFPIAPDAVADMDRWIEELGAQWGIEERMLFRARVCVSELATNVIEHGRVQANTGVIGVELRHKPPLLEIEMSDPGIPFDPVAAPPIVEDGERFGGRGLRLVRAYTHALAYRRIADRNILNLQIAPKSG
jgi:anti-sigma regulatory factor (Ser/Thr protein kinase)